MYAISVQHLPGYSSGRDHLFVNYEACMEQWQCQRGYATKRSARLAYERLNDRARRFTTFDGQIIVSICLKGATP